MLTEHGVAFDYREYREDPLSKAELRTLLRQLRVGPKALLRKNDRAYKELGLDGEESDAVLIGLMAEHPTLLQRPIGIRGPRAVVGRPPERLLELL